GQFMAVLSKDEVFLADPAGVVAGSAVAFPKKTHAGFHGLAWSPDGGRLFATTDKGYLQTYRLEDRRLVAGPKVELPPASAGGRGTASRGAAATRRGSWWTKKAPRPPAPSA